MTKSLVVTITPSPTLSFTASPSSIASGSSSTLTWSSTNTTSCTASGDWSGTKTTSGTQSVSPASTTTYTLTCTGAGGSVTKSATVTVTAAPPPAPTLSFYASPTSIVSGSSSTLYWTSTNATSCTASNGWSGTKTTSGYLPVSPISTTTYTLICTGAGGSVTKSATVTVNATPTNGICGSSNGVPTTTAPTVNLCSAGTASPVTGTGPWTWTCIGSNGGSTATCSASKTVPSTLRLCVNGAELSGITLAFGDARNLRTYYDTGSGCSGTDVTASTTFAKYSGDDAVTLSGNGTSSVSIVAKNPDSGAGQQTASETLSATYSGQSKNLNVTVAEVCTLDCSSVAGQYCSNESWDMNDSCGVSQECVNAGTRSCEFNWKEVVPGF